MGSRKQPKLYPNVKEHESQSAATNTEDHPIIREPSPLKISENIAFKDYDLGVNELTTPVRVIYPYLN